MTWLALALILSFESPVQVHREAWSALNDHRYADADQFCRNALAEFEVTYGPDSLEVALVEMDLTVAYRGEGYLVKAEKAADRSVRILQQRLGADDANVALALGQLGEIYFDLHRYTDARHQLRRALEIGERTLERDHPQLAAILNDLAAVYHIEHHYAEAEPLYRRALAIRERTLGPNHPYAAVIRRNLAELERACGDKQSAALAFVP
jgi:tetratricopeptide (TPR) repeat protein